MFSLLPFEMLYGPVRLENQHNKEGMNTAASLKTSHPKISAFHPVINGPFLKAKLHISICNHQPFTTIHRHLLTRAPQGWACNSLQDTKVISLLRNL